MVVNLNSAFDLHAWAIRREKVDDLQSAAFLTSPFDISNPQPYDPLTSQALLVEDVTAHSSSGRLLLALGLEVASAGPSNFFEPDAASPVLLDRLALDRYNSFTTPFDLLSA